MKIEDSGLTGREKHEVELAILVMAFDSYMLNGNPEKVHKFIKRHGLPDKSMSLAEIMSEYFKKYNLGVKFNKKGEMIVKENR